MLKTVSTANGLVSPTFSGDVTLSTGNLVIGTSGKGIDFSATPGTGTSELLSDYEEGTWTPVLSSLAPGDLNVVYSSQVGFYTRIGRTVTAHFNIVTSTFTRTTASSIAVINGLPFTVAATGAYAGSVAFQGIQKTNYTQLTPLAATNATFCVFPASAPGTNQNYVNLEITDMPSGGTVILRGSVSYIV